MEGRGEKEAGREAGLVEGRGRKGVGKSSQYFFLFGFKKKVGAGWQTAMYFPPIDLFLYFPSALLSIWVTFLAWDA